MIELDGSHEEGGGQILRTALGLSVITGRPFRIKGIRKNRKEPGLKQQHVSCVKACQEFSNAYVEGNKKGSDSLEFVPKQIKGRQMNIDIGTAGSVTLLLQSVLLPLMFTESDIKITGGTDVKWSMSLDYFRNIVIPMLADLTNIEIKCGRRGYYPVGNGAVEIRNKPKYRITDFDNFSRFHQYIFGNPIINLSEVGKLTHIKGMSHASRNLQNAEVAERQAKAASLMLQSLSSVTIDTEYSNTDSTGSGIMVYAIFHAPKNNYYRLGADITGEKGMKSEEVGRQVSEKIMGYIRQEIVVDEHLQDNIIPLLGLFGGKIRTGKITKHTLSNIHVCEKFLNVEYEIEKKENQIEASFISVLSSSKS